MEAKKESSCNAYFEAHLGGVGRILWVDESCWVNLHHVHIHDCSASFYARSKAISICLSPVATIPYRI